MAVKKVRKKKSTQKYRPKYGPSRTRGRLNPGTRSIGAKSRQQGAWTVVADPGTVISTLRKKNSYYIQYNADVEGFGYAFAHNGVLSGNWEVFSTIIYGGSTMGQPPHPNAGNLLIAAATDVGVLRSPATNKAPNGTEFIGAAFTNHTISVCEGITGGGLATSAAGIALVPDTKYWFYMRRQVDLLQVVIYNGPGWTNQRGNADLTRSVVTAFDYPFLVAPSFGVGGGTGLIKFTFDEFSFTF